MQARGNLTFNLIGRTMESPSQNPPACLYKPGAYDNKAELLRQNPFRVWLPLACQRGWVGGQQAHFFSGPLSSAEGSSTASLFLQSAPRIYKLVSEIIFTLIASFDPHNLLGVGGGKGGFILPI